MAKSRARKLADIIVGAGVDIDGNLTFDGGSTSEDLTFADNDKANFGDSSDLQIFHSGSHSFIKDAGTGDLYIGASNNIALMNADFTENYLLATADDDVHLYHNGVAKFATSSTGVTVTGRTLTDTIKLNTELYFGSSSLGKLTQSGSSWIFNTYASSAYGERFRITDSGVTVTGSIANASGNFTIDSAGTLSLDAESAGEVIFKHSGTSFASIYYNNNVYITSNISDKDIIFRGIDGSSGVNALTLDMSEAGAATFNSNVSLSNGGELKVYRPTGGSSYFGILMDSGEKVRLRNSWGNKDIYYTRDGNLGISTSSPASLLHVQGSNSSAGDLYTQVGVGNTPSISIANINSSTDNTNAALYFRNDGGERASVGARFVSKSTEETELRFSTTDSSAATRERVTIKGDGKLGVGTTSPAGTLHVVGTNAVIDTADGSGLTINRPGNSAHLHLFPAYSSVPTIMGDGTGGLHLGYNSSTAGIRINTSNNVGVGTVSPAAKLHISGNSDVSDEDCMLIIEDVDGSAGSRIPAIMFRSNTGGSVTNQGRIRGTDTQGMVLSGSSALGNDLVVQASGVGIGTNFPESELTLQDDDATLRIRSATTTTKGLTLKYNHSGNFGQLLVDHQGNNQLDMKYYALTHKFGRNDSSQFVTIADDGATTITSADSMLLTLNPTANNYGGIAFKYGGVTKGASIFNSGMMVYGGESEVSTALQAGGQYGLFIHHSTRHVGIGMSNATPSSVLNVRGDGGSTDLTFKTEDASANETFFVQDGGRTGVRYYPLTVGIPSSTAAASGALFQVEEAGHLFVNTTGNVGIGTTSPDSKLSVTSSTINSEDIVYLKSGADNVNDYLGIAWELGIGGNGPHAAIRVAGGPSANDVRLGLFTTSDGGNLTEGLSVAHNGNVGIGTTSPSQPLQVNPPGGGYNLFFGRGNSTPGSSDPWLGLFNATTIGPATYGWGFYDSNSDGSLQIWNRNNSTTGDVALTIKRGGNVGIGTASPFYKFDIYGTDDVTMRIHRPSSGLGNNDTCGIGFSHRGDANTSTSDTRAGIFSTYNGSLFLATEPGGNLNSNPMDHAALMITGTNQNIGINDLQPDRKVSIIGDNTSTGKYPLSLDATDTDYTLEFRRNGTSEWWIKQASSNFNIHKNGVGDYFRIDSSGRVGIRNTGAANYTGSGSNSLVVGTSSTTNGSHGITIVAGNQATSSIAFTDHTGDGSATDYRGLFQYVHSDDSLRVFTASNERIRVMSNGDIGFGTAGNPQRSFDVRHGLNIFGTGGYTELMLRGRAGTAQNLGAFHWSIRSDVGGNNDDLMLLRFTGGNSPSYAGTSLQIRNDNGFVGIGTNTGQADGQLEIRENGGDHPTVKIRRGLDGGRVQFAYGGNTSGFGEIGQTYYGTGRTRIWMGANLESFHTAHSGPSQQDGSYAAWFSTWDSYADEFTVNRIASGTTSEVLTLNYLGRLGVGTTNPTQKLEVAGGIKFNQFSAGHGLNVVSYQSFNNSNTANSCGSVYYSMFILNIYHNNGHSQCLFVANGGGGVGYNFTGIVPGNTSLITGTGINTSFTTIGSSPNTFQIQISSGGGALTVSRTNGTGSFGVSVHKIAGA